MVEKLPPEILLKVWQGGKSLDKACFEYCDAEYLHAFPKQPQLKSNHNYESKSPLAIISEGMQKLSEMTRQQENYQKAHKVAWDNLVKNLSDKITQNELIAIGFETPINADFPVYIPLHMWPPENMDMQKSAISTHGKTYVRVRLVKREEGAKTVIPAKEVSLPNTKVQSNQVGRPSVGEQIVNAYERLEKEGKIEHSKSLKAHYKLIQDTIRVLYKVDVSDKTIHKYLGEKFKAEKKSTN